MTRYEFTVDDGLNALPRLGLIVRQHDETVETEIRRLLPADRATLCVSRLPGDEEVSAASLHRSEAYLADAAGLLPDGPEYDVLGYGCALGTAQCGVNRVAVHLKTGRATRQVTQPVTALVGACRALGISQLGMLSPHAEKLSDPLREMLMAIGIDTPVFGSFEEPREAAMARIDRASIISAASDLAQNRRVEAVFVACTNLRTLDAIEKIEEWGGKPVLTSNQVLAWHMAALAKVPVAAGPGRLLQD